MYIVCVGCRLLMGRGCYVQRFSMTTSGFIPKSDSNREGRAGETGDGWEVYKKRVSASGREGDARRLSGSVWRRVW